MTEILTMIKIFVQYYADVLYMIVRQLAQTKLHVKISKTVQTRYSTTQ